jgi:WD40 repeat protein/MinD-like ATPase involved in chromosome partitioning or flagellar assembly
MSGQQIVTFYSYKGGTGRSMALANVAWILAANGNRVLVIDWDLEAPGLHRYFHPFLADKELVRSEGVIDFVMRYAEQAVTKGKRPNDWYKPYANILRYATSLDHPFAKKASIDFVPAGRQGADYATRVNAFNWQHFYERLSGGLLLEAAKLSMADYDYVLIDSRTGVSDTSGICTVQMPNTLVVCFTLNTQSIEGAAAVAESADAQRRNEAGEPTLRILPAPTRVESTERLKLEAGMAVARKRFDPLLWHINGSIEDYWARVAVQYQPFYAFEEVLAVFGDAPGKPNSMLASMESLAGWIADRPEALRLPTLIASEREALLGRYLRQTRVESPYIVRTLTGHEGMVQAVAISPDGTLVVSGDDRGIVMLWDRETGARKESISAHTGGIRAIAFCGADDCIWTAGDDGMIGRWPIDHAQNSNPESMGAPVRCLAATADGKSVVWGSATGGVWANDSLGTHSLGRHNGPVWAVAVTSDSKFAVSGSFDRILVRWHIPNAQSVMTYSGHSAEVSSVAISGDDKFVLSGAYDNTLKFWDLQTGTCVRTLTGHSGRLHGVAFSPDARIAASASADQTVNIWNIATGDVLLQLTGHSAAVNAVAFSPDGRRVISASDDGTVIEWNIEEAVAKTTPQAVEVDMALKEDLPVGAPLRLRSSPEGPLVYLSYTHADRDGYLIQFVKDLEEELGRAWGESGETISGWDPVTGPGDVFSEAFAAPLRLARVGVCVISPSYFESIYCGKEFSVLRMRSKQGGGILPVVWSPADPLPEAMSTIAPGPGDVAVYRNEGLAYTMRLSRHRLAYEKLVQQFASEVVKMARSSPLTALAELPPMDELPNAFGGRDSELPETVTERVTFVIGAESTFGKPLFAIAQEISAELHLRAIQDHIEDVSPVIARTAATKSVLVFIADRKGADAADLANKLSGQSHCALLSINTEGGIKVSPRAPRGIGYYSTMIRSEAALRDALRNAIVKIRHAMIARSNTGDAAPETPILPNA